MSNGDRAAFDEIYRRNWSAMYLAAFNMLQDHEACMDVIHGVFVWIWNRKGSLEIAALKAYLISAVKYPIGKCKAAFPGMNMAVQKYKHDKDVVFYFVDTQEKMKDYEAYLSKYLKDHNFDFNVLFDADAKFSQSYGVGPIPHKMVIDKNGNLRFSEVGYMGSPSELVDEISMMVELARKGD